MKVSRLLLLCALAAALLPAPAASQPRGEGWALAVNLQGPWRFRLGDDPAWADPALDDKAWETLYVPSIWEHQGFEGYDGFAWYRKHFRVPLRHEGRLLTLHLGRIDDVGAVYVNGHYVGEVGTFPPKFKTGYHEQRDFLVPPEYLHFGGTNVIAVRVYDAYLEGGLRHGRPGLYFRDDAQTRLLARDLRGLWRFRPGDDPAWRAPALDDKGWATVVVPGNWEPQGFEDYDGWAWYRKRFYVPPGLAADDLVLVLGFIDDLDEAFVNGVRVGGTGNLATREIRGDEWVTPRLYPIPRGVLRFGEENVVAVRVYDGLEGGGLYRGPFGLVSRENLEHLYDAEPEGFWHKLLRLFNFKKQ